MKDLPKLANKRLNFDIDYNFYIYDRAINARRKISEVVDTKPYFNKLLMRYYDPVSLSPLVGRTYHNFNHIEEGIHSLAGIENDCNSLEHSVDNVLLAWFYHDIIYKSNPKTTTNEEESAWYCLSDMIGMGLPAERAGRIYDLVLWTKHDKNPPSSDYHANLIIDIDLLRTALPVDKFFNQNKAIRQEFAFVDDKAWAEGRLAFWKGLLERKNKKIFRTSHFEHLNDIAISNIEKEMAILQSKFEPFYDDDECQAPS
jgi:predicted metal-dependent HD superfamily phosphohydrolase